MLVGVGQVVGNRDRTVAGAREPVRLIVEAVHAAGDDAGETGHRLLRELDCVSTTRPASWACGDLPAQVASRIGAEPARAVSAPGGGHWAANLIDAAAARIAAGETSSELIAGGESAASLAVLAKAGVDPAADLGWVGVCPDPAADGSGVPASEITAAMAQAGLVLPTRVYPMVDTAFAKRRGESPAQMVAEAAWHYAALSRVAAANPAAWNPAVREADEIARIAPGNRMVCEPYPLAVNAMPLVDQAAAVLLTSLGKARDCGVPVERLAYVWGGAGAREAADVLARPELGGSVALCSTLDRTLAAGGLTAAELDVIDLYSCFPVVPRLAARYLGLPLDAVTGATGAQSSFGGPVSSYSLHSVVACAGRIRAGTARTALVHANGGHLTSHHAVLLGAAPHVDGYIGDPAPHDVAEPGPPRLPLGDGVRHDVTVEAATVEYDREGVATQGFLIGRTDDGRRLAAATPKGDTSGMRCLTLYPDGPAQPPGEHVVGTRLVVTGVRGFAQLDPP